MDASILNGLYVYCLLRLPLNKNQSKKLQQFTKNWNLVRDKTRERSSWTHANNKSRRQGRVFFAKFA